MRRNREGEEYDREGKRNGYLQLELPRLLNSRARKIRRREIKKETNGDKLE
jgi:hypothetical protein